MPPRGASPLPNVQGLPIIAISISSSQNRIDSDRMAPNAEPPVNVRGRWRLPEPLGPIQQLIQGVDLLVSQQHGRGAAGRRSLSTPVVGGVGGRSLLYLEVVRVPARRCRVGTPGGTRPSDARPGGGGGLLACLLSVRARARAEMAVRGSQRDLGGELRAPVLATCAEPHRFQNGCP